MKREATSKWSRNGRIDTFTATFIDWTGAPFYYARSVEIIDAKDISEWDHKSRFERELLESWRENFSGRDKEAKKLALPVGDVPRVGDSVAAGHTFGTDWYTSVRDGVVIQIDYMRRRDGSPRAFGN